MKAYNQSDLFLLLLDAARTLQLTPDASMLQRYKEKRLQRAIKALRSQNIFLYTEGTRTSVNLNDITTIYTQPAGVRLMVVGYSDNLRYGATQQPDAVMTQVKVIFPQMHRIRTIGNTARAISEDLVPAQAGASGQPRFTSVFLPVPFILEADEQIAIDLSYDTAMSAPASIPAQAFTFFCVKVKAQLSPDDNVTIEDIKTYIANHNYQRGIFLNCATLARNDVHFSTAVAGGVAECDTRPASGPLMITGIGTTLAASRFMITDTATGHSFTLNRNVRTSALAFADSQDETANFGVPVSANIWTQYLDFPVPHLLRPGARLHCEVINGGTDAQGIARVDTQAGNIIIFQGSTV